MEHYNLIEPKAFVQPPQAPQQFVPAQTQAAPQPFVAPQAPCGQPQYVQPAAPYHHLSAQQPYVNYQGQGTPPSYPAQPGYPLQPSYLAQPKKKSKGLLIGGISAAAVLVVAVAVVLSVSILSSLEGKIVENPTIPSVVLNNPAITVDPLADPVTPAQRPSTDSYTPKLIEEYHSDAQGLSLTIGERWKKDFTGSGENTLYLVNEESKSFILFYEQAGVETQYLVKDIDFFIDGIAEGFDADEVDLVKHGEVKLGAETWYRVEFIVYRDDEAIHMQMYFIDTATGTLMVTLVEDDEAQDEQGSEKDEADLLAMLETVELDKSQPTEENKTFD
ncbi:MAG: hypothetical protein LBS98_07300 [Coriobacteriales bacterium]|nr:hypothetical protein [Coriobacteriales bacterium]